MGTSAKNRLMTCLIHFLQGSLLILPENIRKRLVFEICGFHHTFGALTLGTMFHLYRNFLISNQWTGFYLKENLVFNMLA